MSGLRASRWVKRLGVGVIALLSLGIASWQSAPAQTRTLTSLADVPAFIPAPYHPHMSTAVYGVTPFDDFPYSLGVYQGVGLRYWH